MKKNILFLISFCFLFVTKIFASSPWVVCDGLPGCDSNITWKSFFEFIWNLISYWIRYVAVVAVISLVLSWFMYLLSWWEDEKVKKAKKWITWSLVWVLLSVSAWSIINLVNQFNIN